MNFTSKANGLIDIVTHNHTLSFSKKIVRVEKVLKDLIHDHYMVILALQ